MAADQIRVADAGARYGVHPTWKTYSGNLDYYMFEPDPDHAPALAEKYAGREDQIHVHPLALGAEPGEVEFNAYRHRGLNSQLSPDPESIWSGSYRADANVKTGSFTASMVALDGFATEHGLAFDFLKCDTEGTEYDVLTGARDQLRRYILGVFSEVQLGNRYQGGRYYGDVDELLRSLGFKLLALDIAGRSSPMNKYYLGNRFGMLEAADAIWIKPAPVITEDPDRNGEDACWALLKLAGVCFLHEVPDVAIHYMEAVAAHDPAGHEIARATGLGRFLKVKTQYLFKTLETHLAFETADLDAKYESLFGEARKTYHDFFEDPELNSQ
jgi:FkbM family methyltransferase